VPLVLLALAGTAVSYMLRSNQSIGRSVGTSPAAIGVLTDNTSPEARHGTAELTLVAFVDYQCPVCRKTDPAMRKAVARDGNIRLVYKDWPIFGAQSERAAEVALAADRQGIYPSVHHALMRMPVDDDSMRRAVEQAGGSWQQVEADLVRHRAKIVRQLERHRLQAFSLGLEGTPSYLIGHVLVEGALSEREFLRAFAQARDKDRRR
jgi:protein-disulfide isomerase